MRAITAKKFHTRAPQEIILEGCIGGHEHHLCVHHLLIAQVSRNFLRIIRVPSRVKGQEAVHLLAVGIGLELIGTLRTVAQVAFLIDAGDGRKGLLSVCGSHLVVLQHIVVVVVCSGHVGHRNGETLQHAAEVLRVATLAYHFGHVTRRNQHILQLLDVSVLTSHVAVDHLIAIHIGHSLAVFRTRNHSEVTLRTVGGDTVALQLLLREVHHHWCGAIHHEIDSRLVEVFPVTVVLGHIDGSADVRDGVDDVGTRHMSHGNTFLHVRVGSVRGRHVRHHLHQDGVVEHRRVEQLLLHGIGQVFIPAHAPRIVLEEAFERFVIGGEDGFRTRPGQCLCITHVVC